ncbi:MAG: homoserine O-acetyltransferase [Phycisphaerae bacterium]
MVNDSVGIVATQYMTVFEPPNELELDCGRRIGPVQVAYETYGTLSRERDNVVLICHALSGDAHVAGFNDDQDRKPGWWDNMVGPGKGIDTNKYFVICANVLGGCKGTTGPGSINPQTGKFWGLDFPVITISDMVKVQKALIDALGIKRLLGVIGGSMGGMLVLEWAIRYPEMVVSALPIATTARLSAQGIAFNAVGRNAILADPNFKEGQYYDAKIPARGLAIARMIGHITYLSEQSMHLKFGRTLKDTQNYRYDFDSEFSVETYLDYQGQRFVERFDANSYLYITKAIDYYDLTATFGSMEQAFANLKSRFLIASFSSDWLFPPEQSRQMVQALLANNTDVTYCDIQSPYGHDAFLMETQTLGALVSGFIDASYRYLQRARAVLPLDEMPAALRGLNGPRYEYPVIEELIDINSKVLDLGCGSGNLLQLLAENRGVDGRGIEIREDKIVECVGRGVTVIQHDLDMSLPTFPDKSFDYVLLSQTLPEVHHPELVLREMLRIGRLAIVSFPNFAYWRARVQFAFTGKAPKTAHLPNAWHQTERIRFLSLKDFEIFCEILGARIITKVALDKKGRKIPFLDNFMAEQAVYVLAQNG